MLYSYQEGLDMIIKTNNFLKVYFKSTAKISDQEIEVQEFRNRILKNKIFFAEFDIKSISINKYKYDLVILNLIT